MSYFLFQKRPSHGLYRKASVQMLDWILFVIFYNRGQPTMENCLRIFCFIFLLFLVFLHLSKCYLITKVYNLFSLTSPLLFLYLPFLSKFYVLCSNRPPLFHFIFLSFQLSAFVYFLPLMPNLSYKSEVHGFDFRWCHWNFSLT